MGKRENVSIIVNGFKEVPPKSDDDMLKELYDAGVLFTDLRTVFNEIIKEKGLRLTAKERTEKTIELMKDQGKIETPEDVLKVVAMLADKLKVATTKAMGSLRTWAKAEGIELPKTPKVSKPRKVGFGGHYKKILDHVLDNRDADKKAITTFCHDNGIPEAYATQAMNVVHFAKVWSGEIEEPEEATA